MNAVGGTTSVLHIMHQCFTYFQSAREFDIQLEIYLLQLQMQLDRCITVSRIIHNTNGVNNFLFGNALDGPENTSEDQESAIQEVLSTIQNLLHKARQEAVKMEADFARIGSPPLEGDTDLQTMRLRMAAFLDKHKTQAMRAIEGIKWGLYKKDKFDKFITDISALIQHLERKVDRESLTLGETRIVYIGRDHSSITYGAEHDDV